MTDFHLLITDWYRQNKRDLPWRETRNPYFIWLSEIILQQTRVDQGMNYYLKFIEHYPTVEDLAIAEEQKVLNDWQGLGYYSRARNLHYTAKYICNELNGIFPSSFETLKKLKGVGPYTAAAIASIAYDEPVSVVDGNVYRVLSRIFNIENPIDSTEGIKTFQQLADELLPHSNAAEFNQAMMEFGALQCKPAQPDCTICPFEAKCQANNHSTISIRPVKSKKIKVRKRYFYYSIFEENEKIVVLKREQKDIWQHLYEFPLLESEHPLSEKELTQLHEKKDNVIEKISIEFKHILSHQHIYARFIHFNKIPKHFSTNCIARNDLIDYPLPRLIDRYWENEQL